jgi:hypothetical protein
MQYPADPPRTRAGFKSSGGLPSCGKNCICKGADLGNASGATILREGNISDGGKTVASIHEDLFSEQVKGMWQKYQ